MIYRWNIYITGLHYLHLFLKSATFSYTSITWENVFVFSKPEWSNISIQSFFKTKNVWKLFISVKTIQACIMKGKYDVQVWSLGKIWWSVSVYENLYIWTFKKGSEIEHETVMLSLKNWETRQNQIQQINPLLPINMTQENADGLNVCFSNTGSPWPAMDLPGSTYDWDSKFQ